MRNVESGGDEITTIEELEGLVGDERMELREEQVQMIKKMKKNKFQLRWRYLGKSFWANVS